MVQDEALMAVGAGDDRGSGAESEDDEPIIKSKKPNMAAAFALLMDDDDDDDDNDGGSGGSDGDGDHNSSTADPLVDGGQPVRTTRWVGIIGPHVGEVGVGRGGYRPSSTWCCRRATRRRGCHRVPGIEGVGARASGAGDGVVRAI